MQILAERAGVLPSSELPSVQLQPVGSEPIGPPTTRSSAWSTTQHDQPATKQEQLDARLGAGAFTVNDDGSLAGCGRCSRHKPTWIHLSHPNWLKNAIAHYESHSRPKDGMQRLEYFGIKAISERLCDAIPARAFEPDYSTACHGFWLDSWTYGDTTYDTDALMNDWKPGACWSAQPRYKATLVQERKSESQELFSLQGSSVQWRRDGIAGTGVVFGYESPTVMFVLPDATCLPALLEAGQLCDRRWAMVSESEVRSHGSPPSPPPRAPPHSPLRPWRCPHVLLLHAGEELEAAAAKRAREQYRPEDLGMRPPSGKARAPPKARVRS